MTPIGGPDDTSHPQPRNPLRAALERFGRERGQSHVHERGEVVDYFDGTKDVRLIGCRLCAMEGMIWVKTPDRWAMYELGVADAAAGKER